MNKKVGIETNDFLIDGDLLMAAPFDLLTMYDSPRVHNYLERWMFAERIKQSWHPHHQILNHSVYRYMYFTLTFSDELLVTSLFHGLLPTKKKKENTKRSKNGQQRQRSNEFWKEL